MNFRSKIAGIFTTLLIAGSWIAGIANAQQAQEVGWKNGDVSLTGSLYLPEGNGPFAAVIILHGSGTLPRTDKLYREHAERLTKSGIAVLLYDKRGVGSSTGDWRTADLNDLAADAEQGVKFLRGHKQIDAKRIGLLGISQGGWVSVIVASRVRDLAFIVWLSGTPLTPAEQGHFVLQDALRRKNHDDAAIAKATELDRLITNVYRTDSGWDDAAKRLEPFKGEQWFKDASLGLQARDSWNWQWYRRFMDYDPIPELRKISIPLLAVYGEQDQIVPVKRSISILDELRVAFRRDITTVLLPGLGHDLSIRRGPPPEKYWQDLTGWLQQKILKPGAAKAP
ncbi:MAG: alpha/beta fold hydrolase [Chloracidobacterium sp.]|nr:alpha/beta fold hydrolase [Chloracidobacterium sp.]